MSKNSSSAAVAASVASTAEEVDALFVVPGSAAMTRLSAVETVRARILLPIEHGLLAPGSKLPKLQHIAEGLEVSAITARRGLESLVEDGVLVRRPGRGGGTFVADTPPELNDSAVTAYRADAQAIRHLIDQRSLMECGIIHEAALRATPAQCDALDALIQQSQDAPSWLEHHGPDTRFHTLIAEISELPSIPTYLATYEALLKYFVPYPLEELVHGRDEHRALVAALRANDPVEAVRITREHVGALHREMFVALPR